jgi:hypothetical protein
MSLAEFEAHLQQENPAFRCYACRDRSMQLDLVARVNNRLGPPADKTALSAVEEFLGPKATTVKLFYAKHDGVLMYEDSRTTRWSGGESRTTGIAFFPVGQWASTSGEMRSSLVAMGWSEDEFTEWLRQGIAFCEIPQSGNYFVIQPTGQHAGKIYYADHDDFNPDPIAESFEAFLDSILADPADFLYRHGCYTRYSDGKTDIQWIPKEYVADAQK